MKKRHSLLRVLILLAILTCGHALTSSAQKDVYKFVVKDGKGKNFRHEIFPLYKANRDAMPEDLARQIDPILLMVMILLYLFLYRLLAVYLMSLPVSS